MNTWPSTLPPIPLLSTFSQIEKDSVARSNISYGPGKSRRRTYVRTWDNACQIKVTQAQIAILDAFYRTTLKIALPFEWIDRQTNETVTFRFAGPPKYAPLGNGIWFASLSLEITPATSSGVDPDYPVTASGTIQSSAALLSGTAVVVVPVSNLFAWDAYDNPYPAFMFEDGFMT